MNLQKLLTLAAVAIVSGVPTIQPVSAQEYQGCFLVDSNAVFRDLSAMCNAPIPIVTEAIGVNEAFTIQSDRTSPQSSGAGRAFATPSRGSGYSGDFGRNSFGSNGGFDLAPFGQSGGLGSYGANGSSSSGRCNVATDRAADGSICGDRAASRRPGGR